MNTKLTLSIDSTIIDEAKKFAKANGQSLSKVVENYLKSLINQKDKSDSMLETPISNSFIGVFETKEDYNYKEALSDELAKKYLKDE